MTEPQPEPQPEPLRRPDLPQWDPRQFAPAAEPAAATPFDPEAPALWRAIDPADKNAQALVPVAESVVISDELSGPAAKNTRRLGKILLAIAAIVALVTVFALVNFLLGRAGGDLIDMITFLVGGAFWTTLFALFGVHYVRYDPTHSYVEIGPEGISVQRNKQRANIGWHEISEVSVSVAYSRNARLLAEPESLLLASADAVVYRTRWSRRHRTTVIPRIIIKPAEKDFGGRQDLKKVVPKLPSVSAGGSHPVGYTHQIGLLHRGKVLEHEVPSARVADQALRRFAGARYRPATVFPIG